MRVEDEFHNPVPGHEWWHWWSWNGWLYARRPGSSPPWVVRVRDFTSLVDAIRTRDGKTALGPVRMIG